MNGEIFWPPAKDLAEFFGVHISTARRWRREHYAPPAVIMLLSRDLGCFDAKWTGWRIVSGSLVSPEGITLTAPDALSYPFMRLQIATLQGDNRKLRQEIDAGVEEQPQPSEWDLARVLAG